MLLLRHCHNPRMNFLARSVTRDNMKDASRIHDEITRNTFSEILGLDAIDNKKWDQATLNVKHGGFGLRPLQEVLCPAFVAAWAHSLKELPKRFCSLTDKVMSTFSEESSDSVASSLHSAVLSLPQSLDDGTSTLSEQHSLVTLAANPKGLQHCLSADISLLKAGVCLTTAVTTRDAARIRSTQGRCAGAWLDTVTTDEKYSLQPNEYRIASFLRLGLPCHSLISFLNVNADSNWMIVVTIPF